MSQSKRISIYFLVLVAGFAVTAGVWPNDKQALALTQDYARPLFVVLIATLGWVLAKRLYPRSTRWVGEVRDVGVKRLWPLVFVLLATVLSCTREPHNFKVTADEYVLSSQALNMHISGWSQVPSRMHEINGVFRSTSGTIDKRPPLFVVLLSLVHDVTGYRVNNVFATPYPRYENHSSGAGVQPYGDWRGRVYSLSLTTTFWPEMNFLPKAS